MNQQTEYSPSGKSRIRTGILIGVGAVILFAVGLLMGNSTRHGENAAVDVAVAEGWLADTTSAAEIWTCAMHPQIRQPKPGKCPICAMDLVPVTQGTGPAGGRAELKLSPAARKLAEIQTAPVERRDVAMQVRLTGKVEYDETRVSYITAWVPGRLDHLYVDYTGVTVKPGDPMVSIYSPELVTAQEELLQSAKALSGLQAGAAESLKQTSVETLRAVREKLRLLGLTPEQIAEIEQRGTVSNEVIISSPAGGVVVDKSALEGQYVTTGTRIYTIADLAHVWVNLDAYESDLQWIRLGQHVDFSTDAYPGDTFVGVVAFIDPVLDAATRTAKVRVEIPNPRGKLKPEMFVHGLVYADIGNPAEEPLVIPASAPLITGKRAVVYVETEPGLYSGREITLGPRAGDFYVVEEGLAEGERVVTNGNFKIDSAVQILAEPSMMNPGGAAVSGRQSVVSPGEASDTTAYYPREAFEVPPEFADRVGRLYDAYLGIHYGLSRDSLATARAAAAVLQKQAASADPALLTGAARRAWTKYLTDLELHTDELRSAEDISTARTAFAPLSDTMYAVMKGFGAAAGKQVYRIHCSMAFGGEGAFWLQSTPDVENPYWGAAMFTCGEMSDVMTAGPTGAPGGTRHE
jgi:Cu(I)/Ag(I) efflux system membrane fusion protein